MKKLLLASVFAIASFPGYAHAEEYSCHERGFKAGTAEFKQCLEDNSAVDEVPHPSLVPEPPAHVTVAPPYQGPPPIGWIYFPNNVSCAPGGLGPYGICFGFVVNVQAAGLNVRVTPNGPPIMALVNGTPIIQVDRRGNWALIAAACDLTPTWLWSWTANVPLNRCWVYF
jgi:hypothetical protein